MVFLDRPRCCAEEGGRTIIIYNVALRAEAISELMNNFKKNYKKPSYADQAGRQRSGMHN